MLRSGRLKARRGRGGGEGEREGGKCMLECGGSIVIICLVSEFFFSFVCLCVVIALVVLWKSVF